MNTIDGFMYYNSNKNAGASQSHKHLQVVPYGSFPTKLLLTKIDRQLRNMNGLTTLPWFNFAHAIYKFNCDISRNPLRKSKLLYDAYRSCKLSTRNSDLNDGYNLVLTHKWMLLVKRRRDSHLGVKMNSMAFVGSFAVRTKNQCNTIEQVGPLSMLKAVCY
jgi:ATP adenylyltransferase